MSAKGSLVRIADDAAERPLWSGRKLADLCRRHDPYDPNMERIARGWNRPLLCDRVEGL